jgi:hypothetical protein
VEHLKFLACAFRRLQHEEVIYVSVGTPASQIDNTTAGTRRYHNSVLAEETVLAHNPENVAARKEVADLEERMRTCSGVINR